MAADTHQACWTVEAKATALRNQRKLAVHYYHNSYSTFPKIQAKSTWDGSTSRLHLHVSGDKKKNTSRDWEATFALEPETEMLRLGKPILLSLMNKSSFSNKKKEFKLKMVHGYPLGVPTCIS